MAVIDAYKSLIKTKDIDSFKDQVYEGSKIKLPDNEDAIVTKKYPHIVMTDKGSYPWIDIYMANSNRAEHADD